MDSDGDLSDDRTGAKAWWKKLEVFLACQETAEEMHEWPAAFELSHGDAGEVQLVAEQLAHRLGRTSEYRAVMKAQSGPIAELASNVNSRTGRPEASGDPCTCGWEDASGTLKTRAQCNQDNDPCLVALEAKRRSSEAAFWSAYRGTPCCKTIADCPLRESQLLAGRP